MGAGKSAIARVIVASASGACAYIEGDTYWSFIQRPLKSDDPLQNFKMVMRAMIASARHFERSLRAAARADGAIADYRQYSELYAVFDGGGRFTIADDVSSAADLAARIRADLSEGAFLIT